MARDIAPHNRRISDSLHPFVNAAIVGLVLLFVVAVWVFFDSDGYAALLDAVVTGLFVMAIGIPFVLWLTWRRHRSVDAEDDARPAFRDWVAGDFDTWTGRVSGANATAEVLLPIAAVAIGMTVLGLVFHIVATGIAPVDVELAKEALPALSH